MLSFDIANGMQDVSHSRSFIPMISQSNPGVLSYAKNMANPRPTFIDKDETIMHEILI
jgi:hypothetical protein